MAYLFPLSLFSVFAGIFSDKVDRIKLLDFGSIIWSLITFAHSETDSFELFVIFRMMFGLFSAILNPAALSLKRDYFPEN